MNRKSTQSALWASFIYAVLGSGWIFFSDRLLGQRIQDLEHLTRLEINKGLCFILFTALLLFFAIRHLLAKGETQVCQLQKADALTQLQKETLELIAGGRPPAETLRHLLKGIEAHSPDMVCAIMQLTPDGRHLRLLAAPSLPEGLAKASDGLPVGPKVGSCGTAAFRGSPVFVSDIATDPLWAEGKEVVLPHGFHACWSTPILDEQKRVLGTFAIYHRAQGLPTPENVRVIEIATHTAATAIVKAQTEQSLRENEERFRTLFEQASDAIFVHDREGRLLNVNAAACASLGYRRSELLTKNVADVEATQTLEHLQEIWGRLSSGEPLTLRGQHRRKDGSVFPVEVRLSCSRVQGQCVFLAIARNITDRAEYEARLAASEESYRNFFNTVTDAIYVLDQEGKFLDVNDGAVAMYGHPKEFFAGKTPEILSAPGRNDLATSAAAIQKAFAGEPQEFEWWGIRANGEVFPKEVKLQRGVYFGQPVVFATGRDITERLHAEKKRQELEAQLRQSQKMEAIGQLSGGVAHDFNNILTVIQGNASMLQGLELSPAETRDYADQISRAADRASALTRQLLMFARKQQMQPANLDLNEVVAQITKMLRRILGEDITLRTEFAPALPPIHADAGMLEQIVLNLAVNARDAMANGGTLAIRTSWQTSSTAHSGAPEIYVRLDVTDNGCGIPPAVLPRIFEPFFTTKEVGKGTGLGLATVYGIVEQHRGQISVTSEPGKTTFTILFPAATGQASPENNAASKPVLPWGTETILVVEDELSLRSFVSDLLQRCGYTVLEAESGPAALKIWETRADEISLVFTDIIMPGNMSGLELGQILVEQKPGLKVVFTSGYAGNIESHLNAALFDGKNFLRKPYKPEVLAALIRSTLDRNVATA